MERDGKKQKRKCHHTFFLYHKGERQQTHRHGTRLTHKIQRRIIKGKEKDNRKQCHIYLVILGHPYHRKIGTAQDNQFCKEPFDKVCDIN